MKKRSGIENRIRAIIDANRRKRGATITQVAAIAAIAVLIVFVLANLGPILATGPDTRESLFEDAMFAATKRQRKNSEMIRMLTVGPHVPTAMASSGNPGTERVRLTVPDAQPTRRNEATLTALRNSLPSHHALKSRTSASKPIYVAKYSAESSSSVDRNVSARLRRSRFGSSRAPIVFVPRTAHSPLVATRKAISGVRPVIARPAITMAAHGFHAVEAKMPLMNMVQPFHRVVVGLAVNLILHVDNSNEFTVSRPTGNEGPLACSVDNGVLHVTGPGGLTVVATTRSLDNLEVSAGSRVDCDGITGRAVKVSENGGSSVAVRGHADVFSIDLNGSSSFAATGLASARVEANISGGSSANLRGQLALLDLNVNGGSSAAIYGRTSRLELTGDSGATVDCSHLAAGIVRAAADHGSTIKLNVERTLTADAKNASGILYIGNPASMRSTPDISSHICHDPTVSAE